MEEEKPYAGLETMNEDAAKIIFIGLSIFFAIMLDSNLISALIFKNWEWIKTSWLSNENKIMMPISYIFVHVCLIISIILIFKKKK